MMNLEQRKQYLEKFHKAYYKFIALDEDLKGLKSVDLTKSPNHNSLHVSLTEKIYKRDEALADVFKAHDEIYILTNGNPYIMAKYASFDIMTNKEAANFFCMTEKVFNQNVDNAIMSIDL